MNYVITIGRQLGSGGKFVGEKLSQKLQIPCYDKELIRIASLESGLGHEFFEKADEKVRNGLLSHFFGIRSGYENIHNGNCLTYESLFQIQSDVIRRLSEKESCIFIGHCADYVLRNHPQCLKLFICANISERIDRINECHNITEKEAYTLLEQSDKQRAAYYNYYSNKEWGIAKSYDLCANSSVFGINGIVQIVENYVTQMFI